MTDELPAADWSAWAPADHAGIRWEGRLRFEDDGSAVYDWTQVRLHARFTGSRLAIYAETNENYLDVSIDGQAKAVLGRKPSVDDAPLSSLWLEARHNGGLVYVLEGLGDGEHQLLIAKRTSPNIGLVHFRGLRLDKQGRLLSPPGPLPRRIEFIGDSLTNGYGDEGPGLHCAQLPPYENSSRSWARLCATALGAEAQFLAYSGYGMVRNYGDKASASSDPFPSYYPHTVLAENAVWDRAQFVPQVAVVFLGSNDYSTEPSPQPEDFIRAYRAFLAKVREGRGRLPVLCVYPHEKQALLKAVEDLVAQEQADGLPTEILGFPDAEEGERGCDWHPLTVVHARWAALAEPKLREMMKW